MFSFDDARKRLVLRQFHKEGFVNQYVHDPASADKLVFATEAIETSHARPIHASPLMAVSAARPNGGSMLLDPPARTEEPNSAAQIRFGRNGLLRRLPVQAVRNVAREPFDDTVRGHP